MNSPNQPNFSIVIVPQTSYHNPVLPYTVREAIRQVAVFPMNGPAQLQLI